MFAQAPYTPTVWSPEQIQKFAQKHNLQESHIKECLAFTNKYKISNKYEGYWDFDETLTDVNTWDALKLIRPDSFTTKTNYEKQEIVDKCFPGDKKQKLLTLIKFMKECDIGFNINTDQYYSTVRGILQYIGINMQDVKIYARDNEKSKYEKVKDVIAGKSNIFVIDDLSYAFNGFKNATCILAKQPILTNLLENTSQYFFQTNFIPRNFVLNPLSSTITQRLQRNSSTISVPSNLNFLASGTDNSAYAEANNLTQNITKQQGEKRDLETLEATGNKKLKGEDYRLLNNNNLSFGIETLLKKDQPITPKTSTSENNSHKLAFGIDRILKKEELSPESISIRKANFEPSKGKFDRY